MPRGSHWSLLSAVSWLLSPHIAGTWDNSMWEDLGIIWRVFWSCLPSPPALARPAFLPHFPQETQISVVLCGVLRECRSLSSVAFSARKGCRQHQLGIMRLLTTLGCCSSLAGLKKRKKSIRRQWEDWSLFEKELYYEPEYKERFRFLCLLQRRVMLKGKFT